MTMVLLLPILACSLGNKAPQISVDSTDGTNTIDTVEQSNSVPPTTEFRGIWVTRWSWDTEEDIHALLEDIAQSGFNGVLFQVRGTFDAYYESAIEPWAKRLTGTLGQDPGWDPLETAVVRGHELGLQIHAYLNVFPLARGGVAPTRGSIPEHAYHDNPDWRVADSNGEVLKVGSPAAEEMQYVFASPGNLQVRARIAAVAADIDARYDVDGIHLDYIRYPKASYSFDAASNALWSLAERDGQSDRAQWQREQVNETVRRVQEGVGVPLTAAVWGVHENKWGWPQVSEGNLDYYQDSHAFLEEGIADAIMPMIYWPVTQPTGQRLDFRTLAMDHLERAGDRHVYPGISAMVSDKEPDTYARVATCIQASRDIGAPGWVLFDYATAKPILKRLRTYLLAKDVPPPAMPWREEGGTEPG
jgi:uncharacterized lipoprotein YddW (UPF0748 family)